MPPFLSTVFLTRRKWGRAICQPAKKWDCGNIGHTNQHTNQHKTGTNRHNLCRGRGEAHLPPFHCLLLQWPQHPRTFGEGRGTAARPPDGDVRSGGRLVTGRCRGANVVPSVIPLLRRHNRRHRCCGPIVLTLPFAMVWPLPRPLLLLLSSTSWLFDRPCRRCHVISVIFVVIVVAAPFLRPFPFPPRQPSSSCRLPCWRPPHSGTRARERWRGCLPPSSPSSATP